jgi:hypothetical protein
MPLKFQKMQGVRPAFKLQCCVYGSPQCAMKDWKVGRKGLTLPHNNVCHKLVRSVDS